MLHSSAAFANSSEDMASSSGPDTIFLLPGIPAMVNRESTVTGSSPEMTFRSIPLSRKTCIVSLQSALTSSRIEMAEIGTRFVMRGSPF